ncbi:MAG: FAD-binding and (Fe-S)-binding domain-containing protein [Francisellaceae bacterium]
MDKYTLLIQECKRQHPDIVIITDRLHCFAYGSDASLYRMLPKVVVFIRHITEVKTLLNLARKQQISLTFRAAGTSLSGQAVTDSVLVVLHPHAWRDYRLNLNDQTVTLGCGWVGGQVNKLLARHGFKIGPDPASLDHAKIGGITANNASGMCCGVANNSYHTMVDMTFTLANGSHVNTASLVSRETFYAFNKHMLDQLQQLACELKQDDDTKALIRYKYRLKNTTGLSINALLDYDDPIDILAHLMIGSEGTLGFIGSVTFKLLPLKALSFASLLFFANIHDASHAVSEFSDHHVDMLELMDSKSLKAAIQSGQTQLIDMPELDDTIVCLLVKIEDNDKHKLTLLKDQLQILCEQLPLIKPAVFSSDPITISGYEKLRKSILPAIGGMRAAGSSVVIEDVAVDVVKLPQLVEALNELFRRYQYHEAAIFGHALFGNLHFVFTPRFDSQKEIDRYSRFMQDLCRLISVDFKGSLKAEHGTGRNMAPFVELEWGQRAYTLMWQLKTLIDPKNILNPDVILSRRHFIHLEHLKEIPQTNSVIDSCMECGFCESLCPTRGISFTPRQRIIAYRAQQLGFTDTPNDSNAMDNIAKSCVNTNLCQPNCPVGIDTGTWLAEQYADVFSGNRIEKALRESPIKHPVLTKMALNITNKINAITHNGLNRLSKSLHQKHEALPVYLNHMPKPSAKIKIKSLPKHHDTVVYFASCGTRMMGKDPKNPNSMDVTAALLQLLEKAGFTIIIAAQKHCCGKIHSDSQQQLTSFNTLERELLELSDQGRHPILTDMSSCALQAKRLSTKIKIHDSIEFIHDVLLDKLIIHKVYDKMALHITCSTQHLKQQPQFISIAQRLAKTLVIPPDIGCCGFAGIRGITDPEINQSALHGLSDQVNDCQIGITSNRSCQIGLNEYTTTPYYHIAEILARHSDSIES